MVTWGINPGEAAHFDAEIPENADEKALDYMGVKPGDKIQDLEIDQALSVAVINARI